MQVSQSRKEWQGQLNNIAYVGWTMPVWSWMITDLLQSLTRQSVLDCRELVLVLSETPHLTVRAPVMQCHCCQVVKSLLQIVTNFSYNINDRTTYVISSSLSKAINSMICLQQFSKTKITNHSQLVSLNPPNVYNVLRNTLMASGGKRRFCHYFWHLLILPL